MLLPFRRPEDEGPEDEADEDAAPADGTIDWAAIRVPSPRLLLLRHPLRRVAGAFRHVLRVPEPAASSTCHMTSCSMARPLGAPPTGPPCARLLPRVPWPLATYCLPQARHERAPRVQTRLCPRCSARRARRRSAGPRPRSWGCGARRRRRGGRTPAAPHPRPACSCCRCPTGCPRARRRRRRTPRPRAYAAPSSRTSRRAASRAACASASSARCGLGAVGPDGRRWRAWSCWITSFCQTSAIFLPHGR